MYDDIRQDPEYQALRRELQNLSPERREAFQTMMKEESKKEAMPEFISPQEFAEKTGVTSNTVRRWIREGIVKGKKIGPRKWFIPREELGRMLNIEE